MSQSVDDLIAGWSKERAALQDKVANLRSKKLGRSLTLVQREGIIRDMTKAAAEYKALINEFGRHGETTMQFGLVELDAATVSRLHFDSSVHAGGAVSQVAA